MRIGPRYDKSSANIVTSDDGQVIPWVDEVRYLGVYIVKSTRFRCSVEYAKRSFYRAANGILGKVGIASEEVVLQLLRMKCISILMYGLDVCALNKRSLQSLDFTINRFFMKLFQTSDINIVNECRAFFSFELPSVFIAKKFDKFIAHNTDCIT